MFHIKDVIIKEDGSQEIVFEVMDTKEQMLYEITAMKQAYLEILQQAAK